MSDSGYLGKPSDYNVFEDGNIENQLESDSPFEGLEERVKEMEKQIEDKIGDCYTFNYEDDLDELEVLDMVEVVQFVSNYTVKVFCGECGNEFFELCEPYRTEGWECPDFRCDNKINL